jgi:alkylation response protein AidB-like acyl-CoA dehydrogenase
VDHTPLERAQHLRSLILESRDEIESARRLTADVVDALSTAGFFRLLLPADAGGLEVDPIVAYQVYEELARADASVAWVVWNNALTAVLSRGLPPKVRKHIFGDARSPLANSTRPSGTAIATGAGFRVSGRWSLVSGCEIASWIPVMARLDKNEMRMFFLPRGDYEILDTWHSGGLRGSGSHDVVVDDVYVPGERGCSPLEPAKLEGPLHRFPFASLLAPGCASISLGIATSAFEAALEIVGKNSVADAHLHATLAQTEAQIEAARLALHAAVDEVWAACHAGEPNLAARARLWRAALHTATVSKAVVGVLFEAAGTAAVYTHNRLERCHRDIWTMSQHVLLNPQWHAQAGRMRLGLEPTNPMF